CSAGCSALSWDSWAGASKVRGPPHDPHAMLDLHTHVLPGVDDGAIDVDQAVALCQQLHEQGIATVVATPHWRSPRFEVTEAGIERAWQALTAAVAEQVPSLVLALGAEN